jgi:hypothetical protein
MVTLQITLVHNGFTCFLTLGIPLKRGDIGGESRRDGGGGESRG